MPASPPQPALKCCAPISFWLHSRRVERLAGRALAVPAGNLLVAELAVLGAVAVGARAVGEARISGQMPQSTMPMMMFSPALARAAELVPEAAGRVSPRKAGVVEVSQLDAPRPSRPTSTPGVVRAWRLRLAQLGREAVEHVAVAVELLAAARRRRARRRGAVR